MAKKILGLDLGTNSIGWALIKQDFKNKQGQIIGMGSRIIPMGQDVLGDFESGNTISQTANRTHYRGMRRLNQRYKLRRDRLHRILNLLGFLPEHYAREIEFDNKLGQFKPGVEVKLNYREESNGNFEFLFQKSYQEMVEEFKLNDQSPKIPYDWTLYYLRTKALSHEISKQELAWVILSFNQKRGYYQLRGEEGVNKKDEKVEYKVLKVKDVIPTGDEIKGNPSYTVTFENGWEYNGKITKPQDWENQEREFIVTSKTLKNGELKRTFKKVDAEKDWIAIKKKTEQDINQSGKTVGKFIYDTLLKKPNQKIRGGLVGTIDRQYYKDELREILKKQIEYHEELRNEDLFEDSVIELYPKNRAHQNNIKDKDFIYLFIEDIIFYQRPLKKQKSNISDCPYEKRFYKKDDEVVEVPVKCISKSHPLFQEFRLWQFVQNLKIFKKVSDEENGKPIVNEDVTSKLIGSEEDIALLFEFLKDEKSIKQHQLLNFFAKQKKIEKQTKKDTIYRWNYIEDREYPCCPTRAEFIKRLKKVKGIILKEFLSDKIVKELWHIVYSVTDKKEYVKALKTFAYKKEIDIESFVENFKNMSPYDSDYGAYSAKAIKKLIPLMRTGKFWKENEISQDVKERIDDIMLRLNDIHFNKERIEEVADDAVAKQSIKSFINKKDTNPYKGLNTYQACYAVYERHSEVAEIINWKSPDDIDHYLNNIFKQHQLRNPIVEQVVTETLRVVRDIWSHYGNDEEGFFDEIHLELARDLKNSKENRQKLSQQNTERENTNRRIRSLLEELKNDGVKDVKPYSPYQQETLKLYEEGVYNNAMYDKVEEKEIEKIRGNNSPTKSEILKYKLWLEQGYISPYTGEVIPLSKLFTTDYQVEHIIPQSRFFDNSFNNKVICESVINPYPYKDNQTAYEFIKNQGGTQVNEKVRILELKEYEEHCKTYFKRNRRKLQNLLSEDIPEGFIERQINDTRYINKYVKGILSNVLREEGEREATVKKLIPVPGSITGIMKQEWGLNDKWNELIAPRFKRMNEITESKDYGYWDKKINAFRTQVPKDLKTGFDKKRIDHRHHALDALIIACVTKDHTNYITSLETKRENFRLVQKLRETEEIQLKDKNGEIKIRKVARNYKKPWKTFTQDAKTALDEIIVSFKQNNRVINRTNNKTWHWVKKNGEWKKELRKQKGKNFAIRKKMHKETVSGKINIETPKGKIASSTRTALSEIKNKKHIDKITDKSIQKILSRHAINYIDKKGEIDYKSAFSPGGIEELNKNINSLNNGKPHQPIYKVSQYEIGKKFPVGETGNNPDKYVEAAKGTNLYFAVYWNEEKQKRVFETIPLNEVIEHQKQTIDIPMKDKLPIPVDHIKGELLFYLSPNDLVYVPSQEEIETKTIDSNWRTQTDKIYKMVSSTGNECHFVPSNLSSFIKRYDSQSKVGELGSLNKSEKTLDDMIRIKEVCFKIKTNRIGNVLRIIR